MPVSVRATYAHHTRTTYYTQKNGMPMFRDQKSRLCVHSNSECPYICDRDPCDRAIRPLLGLACLRSVSRDQMLFVCRPLHGWRHAVLAALVPCRPPASSGPNTVLGLAGSRARPPPSGVRCGDTGHDTSRSVLSPLLVLVHRHCIDQRRPVLIERVNRCI